MEALLSLPVIGYYYYSGPSTITTSLNLLFFYFTWSTLVLSHSQLRVEIIGTLGVRILFWLIPSTFFFILDSVIPSITQNFKTQGESGLPTRGRVTTRTGPVWYRVIGVSLFNISFGLAIQAGVEVLLTEILHVRSALQVTIQLPMPYIIFKHVLIVLCLREILQYYIHSYILHPRNQNTFSLVHESYFHSITAPYSFAAHYDHPAAYLLLRFIPTYLPSVVYRVHLISYLITLAIITFEETCTFSGYRNISGLLLGGMTRRQDLHCQTGGKGNFTPFGVLDWLHGTSLGGNAVGDMRRGSGDNHGRRSSSGGITAASLRPRRKR